MEILYFFFIKWFEGEIMKRYFIVFLILISLCSIVTSSSSYNISTIKNFENQDVVLAEFGTSKHCEYCKYAHTALKNIYSENDPAIFEYITLIWEQLPAAQRLGTDYNLDVFPTVFFDGGYTVEVGASSTNAAKSEYETTIETCKERDVSDVDLDLSVDWVNDEELNIFVSVKNNEINLYQGYIRIYVLEKISTLWFDKFDNPYTNVFLYYALNMDINIDSDDTWTDTINWDGKQYNINYLTRENTKVVAAVYNSEKHQGYAHPPDQNPFDAYYIDEVKIATPTFISNPPNTPTISGKTKGRSGNEYKYTFSTIEPDGENVYYWINWGDETNSGWLGPFNSSEEHSVSHTWNNEGDYQIRIKAKDVNNVGSEWKKLDIKMPKIKYIFLNSVLSNLLKNNFNNFYKISISLKRTNI